MSLLISHIQRSSFFDGPGIRTTVFLKGCLLTCPWCCNPECRQKDDLLPAMKFNNKELLELLGRDTEFYKTTNGGITFSGGEPLLQASDLVLCLEELKKQNINVCFETSLFCSPILLLKVINLIDLFIVDVKILDKKMNKKYLNGSIDTFEKNIKVLLDYNKKYKFRFPAIRPYTLNSVNISLLIKFLKKNKIRNIEIFSVHNLAKEKYKKFGLEFIKFTKISSKELTSLVLKLASYNINAKILNF